MSAALKRKSSPGPRPFTPTSAQRHCVTLGVATGMTLPDVAAALDISRST
jgi:hypothetical protein